MNYKNINLLDENTNEKDFLSQETQKEEIKEPLNNNVINILLTNFENKLNNEELNGLLLIIIKFGNDFNLAEDEICSYFISNKVVNFFFDYISTNSLIKELIVVQNIELIYQILAIISKSPKFDSSLGNNFFNLFMNFYNYNEKCSSLGFSILDHIISNLNNEYISLFFDQNEKVNFIISTETKSSSIITSLSFLYLTLIFKKVDFPLNVYDIMSEIMKNQINTGETTVDLAFNYVRFISYYIQICKNVKKVIVNHFPIIRQCYYFDAANLKLRNKVFKILRFSFDFLNIDLISLLIRSFPSSGISGEILNLPQRRKSIFKFLLASAQKGFNILEYYNNSNFLDEILEIQNTLSFECLQIAHQILDLIVENDFKEQVKMMNIFVKMLNVDDFRFIDEVLASIDRLFNNMSRRGRLNEVIKEFDDCDGIEILKEFALDHPIAQKILNDLSASLNKDEENPSW